MNSFSAEKKYSQPIIISLVFLACGIVCAVYLGVDYDFGFWYKLPSYILCPLCFFVSFAVSGMYLFSAYEYTFYGKEDYPPDMFVVTRYFSGKPKTVLSVSKKDIKGIFDKKSYIKYKEEKKTKIKCKSYKSNPLVPQKYYIVWENEVKTFGAEIELNEDAFEIFRELCGKSA